MKHSRLLLAFALGLSACAPQALFFHESTKVAFAADYNTSDTQPLATSFGFKRRIVAVVPAQERDVPAEGGERRGTNREEALSLVSKFNVRAGAREGIIITNHFASGMAARMLTDDGRTGAAAVAALMHSAPVPVDAEGRTADGRTAAQVATQRTQAVMGKFVAEDVFAPTKSKFKKQPDGRMKKVPHEEKPEEKLPDSGGAGDPHAGASGAPDLDRPAATRIAKDAAGHPLIEGGKIVHEALQPDGTWKRVSP